MKILSVVQFQFSRFLVVINIILSSASVFSQGDILTEEDKNIAKTAKVMRQQSEQWEIPKNIYEDQSKEEAKRLLSMMDGQSNLRLNLPDKKRNEGRVLFYVSHSLGMDGLNQVLQIAASTPESLVIFRGVRDADKFAKSIYEIQQYAIKYDPVVNIVIDPTLFRDYGVTKVPTIVYLDEQFQNELARVSGLADPRWLIEKLEQGKLKNFGVRGPVEDIAERDLIEVMQEKVAAIDWGKKKEDAINRYWDKQEFINLPRATKERRRLVDPSIIISGDIKDAEGNILVAKGTKINPLDMRGFDQAVVVFDPLDKGQLETVKRKVNELREKYRRVTLIVTQFSKTDGWNSYKALTDDLDSLVFKLTSDIHTRFEIQYVPSIITADGRNFVVNELDVSKEIP